MPCTCLHLLLVLAVIGVVMYLVCMTFIEPSDGVLLPFGVSQLSGTYKSAHMPGLKKILYWNDAYGDKGFFFGFGQEPFLRHNCRVNACYATHDRTLFSPEEVDAVLWHLRANDKSLPKHRDAHTMFVFWMIESAVNSFTDVRKYNGIFNWTITYRSDSDFPQLAGVVRRLPPSEVRPQQKRRNYAKGKTKMAAWFVSNCHSHSKREVLVRTLQKFVSVDIFGRCGPKNCSRHSGDVCDGMLDTDYKFYLSFENTLCYDYITEKFIRALQHNVIPVVYGLGYENYHMPDHSYIDVLDFQTVGELGDYLKYLDKNDTAYNEYFSWKSHYTVETGSGMNARTFCDMCERLHQQDTSTINISENNRPSRKNKTEYQHPANLSSKLDDASHSKRDNVDAVSESLANGPGKKRPPQQVYRNIYNWFVANQCTGPYENKQLNNFIRGKDKPPGSPLVAPLRPIKGVFK